jgi:2-hydroxy-6-oxonona-2,4-dienedioate hydrolase
MDERSYRKAEQRLFDHEGVTPREHRVHLERLDVDVRVQEVGEGASTLFIHGGPNSGSTWMQLAGRTSGLRCLILDRPGTGLSDPLPDPVRPHNMRQYAEALAVDVLDALDVERAHLVVSSFGGMIGLYSAAAHPERFDRMVQMACPAMAPGQQTPPFMRVIMTPGIGRLIGMLPPSPKAARAILRQIGHGVSLDTGRIPDVFMDWYVALQRHTDTMANEGAMIASAGGPRGFDRSLEIPADVLARVTTPTYFLWGDADTFGGADVAERMIAAMPDAELEMLPAAGHLPWLDDPDHAARVVMSHLLGPSRQSPEQADEAAV